MGMSNLKIKNFGPIKESDVDVKDFLVLAGPQAAGKSIVAKLIYFFSIIKQLIISTKLNNVNNSLQYSLQKATLYRAQDYFFDMFGDGCFKKETEIKFTYASGEYIILGHLGKSEIRIELSKQITDYLTIHDNVFQLQKLPSKKEITEWGKSVSGFLGMEKVVYIPAGRNLTATLGSYLNYWFATMDDNQKGQIDYFARKYIEEVIRLEPAFERGLSGLAAKYDDKLPTRRMILGAAFRVLTDKLLKGEYRYKHGMERLLLDNGDDIEIKYASSGQQEAVWITNILMYYILRSRKFIPRIRYINGGQPFLKY